MSKSKYLKGSICQKSLWLYVHKYQASLIDKSTQALMHSGTDIGALAHSLFKNGVMAMQGESYPNATTAANTTKLITQGASVIFEATFIYDNITVAVDLLVKKGDTWHAYEVKSSTSVKEYHITDASIQYFVIGKCIPIDGMSIMHINSRYIRKGPLQLAELFTAKDITENIIPLQDTIALNIAAYRMMILGTEPNIGLGEHCIKPFTCGFLQYCKKSSGVSELNAINNHTPQLQIGELQKFAQSISYPIGFLSLHTLRMAVPQFDETSPYQPLLFQYNLYCLNSKHDTGKHIHALADTETHPSMQLITSLIEACDSVKSILVYNVPIEKQKLQELQKQLPEFHARLETIKNKIVGIEPMFLNHYLIPSLGNSFTKNELIATVLPENVLDAKAEYPEDYLPFIFEALFEKSDSENIEALRRSITASSQKACIDLMKLWQIIEKL